MLSVPFASTTVVDLTLNEADGCSDEIWQRLGEFVAT